MMAPFNVTPEAHQFLTQAITKAHQGVAKGIRVGVKKAGCSGYEYVLEYIYDNVEDLDFVFDYDTFKIVVDKEIYLKYFKGGTTLDYRIEGLNEGLKFDNPNVASKCGCGESFNLRDDV
jgi:iron-sulfur cluster assembly protein